ncbi:MAG TPA: transporter substrate-binding domain-containing protein [Azospirillaceae bacterium]|nr:transporter substrate-binding domain-containing protein [Azospirillaceae bacterium]
MSVSLRTALVAVITVASSSALAQECKTVKISGHPQFPPLIWEEGASMSGAGIEMAKRVFGDLKIPIEIVSLGAYQRALDQFKAGEIDLIPGIYHFPAREEFTTFVSPPFAKDPAHAWVKKGAKPVETKEQLTGLRGLKVRGFLFGSEFDSFASAKLDLGDSDNINSAFKMVDAGRVDYFLVSDFSGRSGLASSDLAKDAVVRAPFIANTAAVHFGFSKKSPCATLAAKVGERIQAMVASGEAEKIVERGFADWAAKTKAK